MHLEDPKEYGVRRSVPSMGLSPILDRSYAQTLPTAMRPYSQTLTATNRLSTPTLTSSSTVSSDKVKQFVAQQQLEECIAWLQTATLEEETFQTVVDIARKGFPGECLRAV